MIRTITCEHCGAVVQKKRSPAARPMRFCSAKCYGESQRGVPKAYKCNGGRPRRSTHPAHTEALEVMKHLSIPETVQELQSMTSAAFLRGWPAVVLDALNEQAVEDRGKVFVQLSDVARLFCVVAPRVREEVEHAA